MGSETSQALAKAAASPPCMYQRRGGRSRLLPAGHCPQRRQPAKGDCAALHSAARVIVGGGPAAQAAALMLRSESLTVDAREQARNAASRSR